MVTSQCVMFTYSIIKFSFKNNKTVSFLNSTPWKNRIDDFLLHQNHHFIIDRHLSDNILLCQNHHFIVNRHLSDNILFWPPLVLLCLSFSMALSLDSCRSCIMASWRYSNAEIHSLYLMNELVLKNYFGPKKNGPKLKLIGSKPLHGMCHQGRFFKYMYVFLKVCCTCTLLRYFMYQTKTLCS